MKITKEPGCKVPLLTSIQAGVRRSFNNHDCLGTASQVTHHTCQTHAKCSLAFKKLYQLDHAYRAAGIATSRTRLLSNTRGGQRLAETKDLTICVSCNAGCNFA